MKSNQNNTKKSDLSMTIPSQLLEDAGIAEAKCAELHRLRHCVAVLQGKMTALEMIEAIESISKLAEFLTVQLAKACGICDGCGACGDDLDEIKVPPELLDEAGISRDARLEAYVDQDNGLILVGSADCDHDLSDVPDDLLQVLVAAGVCVGRLEEHLAEDDIVYGE
jgi:hypothetical protein